MKVDEKDPRTEPRKVLRCNARIFLKNGPSLKVRTLDISMSGISVMADQNVAPGQTIGLSFEFPIAGIPRKVETVVRVVYSICVGTSGFRIGLEFGDMDNDSRQTLSQITM